MQLTNSVRKIKYEVIIISSQFYFLFAYLLTPSSWWSFGCNSLYYKWNKIQLVILCSNSNSHTLDILDQPKSLYTLHSPDSSSAGFGPFYFPTRNWFAPETKDSCIHEWKLLVVIACLTSSLNIYFSREIC